MAKIPTQKARPMAPKKRNLSFFSLMPDAEKLFLKDQKRGFSRMRISLMM